MRFPPRFSLRASYLSLLLGLGLFLLTPGVSSRLSAQTLLGTWTSGSPTIMGSVSLSSAGTNNRGQTFYASGAGANAFNSLTNNFSIIAFVTPSSTSGLQGIFSTNNQSPGGSGWYLATNGTGLRFTKLGILDINLNQNVVTIGTQQKYTVTVSSTAGVQFFINDALIYTSAHTTNALATANGIAVGSVFSNLTSDFGFAGTIQSVSVYDGLVAVPEPSTYALLTGLSALGLIVARRFTARRRLSASSCKR